MIKILKITTGIALAISVSACDTLPSQSSPTGWDEANETQIDDSLAQSALEASNAAEVLAQIESARTAPMENPMSGDQMNNLPPELLRPTTVEWTGPAVDLTGELAKSIGYSYSVVGQMPPVDVMVSVSSVDEPAVKVFENIGYQVAEFADVFVDPNTKRIEFRFKSNQMEAHAAGVSKAGSLAGNSGSATGVKTRKDRLGK